MVESSQLRRPDAWCFANQATATGLLFLISAVLYYTQERKAAPPSSDSFDIRWFRDLEVDPLAIREAERESENEEDEFPQLFPLVYRDYLSFLLAAGGLILAAGGGIGGGGLLVPIYILVLGFPPKYAIPLSNVTVLGGAIANTLLNFTKRHPLADRPLIDWDLILIMVPMTIAGALIGANLTRLLPETVIVVLMMILLTMTARKTLRKAVQLFKKEGGVGDPTNGQTTPEDKVARDDCVSPAIRDLCAKGSLASVDKGSNEDGLSLASDEATNSTTSQETVTTDFDDDSSAGTDLEEQKPKQESGTRVTPTLVNQRSLPHHSSPSQPVTKRSREESLRSMLLEQASHVPKTNFCVIASMFADVLMINILKGGGAFPSPLGIDCGTLAFWLAQAAIIAVIAVTTLYARWNLLWKTRLKKAVKFPFVEGDILWDDGATTLYPLLCCIAGFVAGLFGIGGGIIKGPIMLTLGVNVEVAAATSAAMILFTSFTAATSFAVFGLIVPGYAKICFGLGLGATLVGQTIMSWLLQRYPARKSYIAFCIGGVVALSALCMTIESVVSILSGGRPHASNLCASHLG